MSWLEPLQVPLIRQAFWGLVAAGVTFSLLGVVIISLRLTGLRFTYMHVGLLGAAIALSLGMNATIGAFGLILVASIVIGIVGNGISFSHNSLSGFFMTGSLAIAFILFAKAGVPAMEVFGIFAGNALLLTKGDLVTIVGLGTMIVLMFVGGFREIQLLLMDRELATALGVPTGLITLLLFLLIGAGVAVSLQLVGALLVDAVLLLPAMAALPLSKGLGQALILTSCFGLISTGGGFLLALRFDLPVGASVALMGTILMGISYFYQKGRENG